MKGITLSDTFFFVFAIVFFVLLFIGNMLDLGNVLILISTLAIVYLIADKFV